MDLYTILGFLGFFPMSQRGIVNDELLKEGIGLF